MKKLSQLVSIVFVGLFFFFSASSVHAALTSTSIRLDRHKSATAPGNVLVTVTTNDSVTETAVKVAVANAWIISSSASSFSVSTANLPTGVTAWPGIGTASGVSGQTITFPSGNLATGTSYGFYITGGIGNNPSVSSTTNYNWSVTTVVSGVDASFSTVGIPVVPNDQIAITAQVIPDSTYYSATISAATSGDTVNQNTQLDFQITYGMTYTADSPITLQAEWDEGSIMSSPGSTVNILEYVIGSATNAYGSTSPIIDTINRTITWTIPSMPANTTNQTVNFSLKTHANYTGSSLVELPVHSRVTYPVTTSDSTVKHYYQYFSTATPTPVPEAGATATPGPRKSCNQDCATDTECNSNFCYQGRCRIQENPTDQQCITPGTGTAIPTPSPNPTQTTPTIDTVQVISITDTSVIIQATVAQPDLLELHYGLDPNNLNLRLTSTDPKRLHLFTLNALKPDTMYYFQLFKVNTNQAISDLFQLKTAQPFPYDLQPQKIILTSQGISLYQNIVANEKRSVVLEHGVQAELNTFFTQSLLIESADVFALTAEGERISLGDLYLVNPGVLSGKFLVPEQNGEYILMIRLITPFGAIVEYPIVEMIVVDPLLVSDKFTHAPIERATVTIWQYDEVRKMYFKLPAPSVLPANPLDTDTQGNVHLALTAGKYKIEVSPFGYVPEEVTFELKDGIQAHLPHVELMPLGWNPIRLVQYYWRTLTFWLEELVEQSQVFAQSKALFDVSALFTLIVLTGVSILTLQAKTLLSFRQLITHLIHRSHTIMTSSLRDTKGTIIDSDTNKPVSQAKIIVLSQKDSHVLYETSTSRAGVFHLPKLSEPFTIQVEAIGYQLFEQAFASKETELAINLEKHPTFVKQFSHNLKSFAIWSVGILFETVLVLSVFAQLFFMRYLGILPVLPFIILSCVNALLWGHYVITHRLRR